MEDFDFNDTAPAPLSEQEFLMENLCVKKGRAAGGYEPPPTRSAARRWKNVNEQNMMTRLNEMHVIKKQNAHMSKEAAREIIRKIPVELLAKEWLSKEDATVDMRAYLVDQILPTLILGVERLLREVDEKGLSATNRFEPEFNPINFLAQYLMRNNPRFSNFAEASPYVRGLREVSEEIKQELFTFEDNRLARIKAETRRKRTDRERYEQEIRQGKERRHSQLVSQFIEWTHYGERNTVELAILQNSLSFFLETVELLPPELQEVAKFGHPLEPTDETGKTLSVKEFAQYIGLFVEDLPHEIFNLFLVHMSKCAATQNASADRENRRIILTNLFLICDYGVLGLLDRARIMTLFEKFWDMLMADSSDDSVAANDESNGTLRNPRRWPVVEVEEVDDILFDAWHDEPDGGITPMDVEIQSKMLEAIRAALLEEAEVNAAKDKAAKEKWKIEQLEQKSAGSGNAQKGEGVALVGGGASLVYYLSRINDASDETETKDKNTFDATEATTNADIAKESEATTAETDAEASAIEEMAVRDNIDVAEAELTLENESTAKEKEEITDGNTEQLEEPSKVDEQAIILGENHQNNDQIEDKKEDIKYKGDSEHEDTIGNSEILQTVNSFVESGTSDGSNIVTAHEVDFDHAKPMKKSQELAEQMEENIKNESNAEINNKNESAFEENNKNESDFEINNKNESDAEENIKNESTFDKDIKNVSTVEEKTDVDIMRELVASQTRMLASKIYTADRAMVNRIIDDKADVAMKDHILELLEDDNKNRNVEDSNVNSCTRARVINTSSTTKETKQLSAFSEVFVDLSQFVQLFETYIGPHPESKIYATLVHYITDCYQDNEPDKTDKLLQAREKDTLARRKAQLNALFEKWDNDASGFLELENVTEYMCKFKDGQEIDAIKLAQFDLKRQSEFFDGRLSKREFRQFLNMVIDELPGKETFDLFVEFLMNSVERSYGERIRGEARKKWLQQINLSARTGGTTMEPVYKAVFQALYKDAETHGGEKRISASISMLEINKLEPSRGELMLRYAASTPEDCQYMLGKPLYKNMKGISFQAAETGKPVHVPRVAKHGNIYFWNYNRNPKARSGSFVAIPLKDNKKRVFGVLGVDTMIDPRKDTIFTKHEIQFFQGVAKSFSIAYHYVEKKRKFLIVLESAIHWFHIRCPNILEITVYFMEPNLKDTNDYVLRKIMVMDNNGKAAYVTELIRLERKENLFRGYLFDCIETSYTVISEIHEMRHAACPIRDNNGMAVGIVDINTGKLKVLPRYESREMQRLLRLLQRAYSELSKISMGEDPQCVLEVESDPVAGVDIMFERLMLQELRDNICRIDPQSYIEIKGFFEPPRVIAEVLRATIAIFKVDQVGEGEYDDWDDLKNCINSDLIHNIRTHDPIASTRLADADKLQRYLKATFSVSFGEIAEQGSILAQQLYNWVFTCLALINYVLRKRESAEGGELVAVG